MEIIREECYNNGYDDGSLENDRYDQGKDEGYDEGFNYCSYIISSELTELLSHVDKNDPEIKSIMESIKKNLNISLT